MLEHKKITKDETKQTKKHNLLEIKEYLDLKYEFRKNSLTLELEYKEISKGDFKVLDESFVNSVWIDLQLDGFKASDNTILKLLNSKLTRTYNPLKEYFQKLPKWDGVDYINQLANTIQIADLKTDSISQKELWESYLKKWLVASVATVLNRGTNQSCLILVGAQGRGKTTWLNKLCPKELKEFLVCSHINPSLTDQNTANYLAEKWFVNIDDQLETIFGKDFNSMKAIITAPDVTNRKTWHRFTKKRQRVCSFMGSVNNPSFLTDSENRRYIVFTAEDIDFKHKVDMNKVWGQALHLLNDKFIYWYNQEEIQQLNQINEIYRQVPIEEEWLMRLYEPATQENPKAKFMMPSQILANMNTWSGMRLSIKRLTSAMQKLKYGKSVSKRINGVSRKVYPIIERSDLDEANFQNQLRES